MLYKLGWCSLSNVCVESFPMRYVTWWWKISSVYVHHKARKRIYTIDIDNFSARLFGYSFSLNGLGSNAHCPIAWQSGSRQVLHVKQPSTEQEWIYHGSARQCLLHP